MDLEEIKVLRAACEKLIDLGKILDSWLAMQSKKNILEGSRLLEEVKVQQNRFIPLIKWPHDWPTLGALRHLAKNRHKRGLDKVFIKVGKRVVINEQAFFEWIKAHSKNRVCSADRH